MKSVMTPLSATFWREMPSLQPKVAKILTRLGGATECVFARLLVSKTGGNDYDD